MADNNRQRKGSLQFYPRVRAKKVIPSVNWRPLSKEGTGLMGFMGYKVGMVSVWVKDNTENSLTKNKKISIPATIVECPSMKIYSIRFYKNKKVSKDFVITNDKSLRKKVKIPKEKKELGEVRDFDDVRVILYTDVKNTSVNKKKPDMIEIGLSGNNEEKLAFIKENIGKEIKVSDVFNKGLVDIRGVTKGYGTQGPVKRFGISLKDHKSEKGRRRPGSISSFGIRRVTFRAPQAGQTGYHNRIAYNNLIIKIGDISQEDINPKGGFEHYGKVKNDYLILGGSIPGPKKRGLVITQPIKPSKRITKKKYEVVEIR